MTDIDYDDHLDGLWGLTVADCSMTDEGSDNAAFIVKAASAHGALVMALAAMVDRWEPDCGGQDRVMWENACAALALATADPVGGVEKP